MIHELVILVPKSCKYVLRADKNPHLHTAKFLYPSLLYSTYIFEIFSTIKLMSFMDLTNMLKLPFLAQKFVDRHGFTYHACIVYKSTYTYTGRDIIILISNSKEQVSTIER